MFQEIAYKVANGYWGAAAVKSFDIPGILAELAEYGIFNVVEIVCDNLHAKYTQPGA